LREELNIINVARVEIVRCDDGTPNTRRPQALVVAV
jgi:hypothetical protein